MASDKLFNFLIFENNNLIYSKYNFDFDLYASNININNTSDTSDTSNTKINIFSDFINRNGSTLDKPTFIKPEFKIYFKPITDSIINYIAKYGIFHSIWFNYINQIIPLDQIELNQFDLIEYPDYYRIQDFVHITYANNGLTKYNFNFELYASDFGLPIINKLFIFTDFIFRNYKFFKRFKIHRYIIL